MTINITKKKLILLAAAIVIVCVAAVLVILKVSSEISSKVKATSAIDNAESYVEKDSSRPEPTSSVVKSSVKIKKILDDVYTVSGDFSNGDYTWIVSLKLDDSDYSKYTVLLSNDSIETEQGKQKDQQKTLQELWQMRQQEAEAGRPGESSSSGNIATSPSLSNSYSPSSESFQAAAPNSSPYTSPPILSSATTPLTRGMDSGYTTAKNITAQGIDFIGGIRKNADKTSTIDLWVINNTKSDVLGGFTVKIDASCLNGSSGDFCVSGNDAIATSTQSLNANYQENVQIHVGTTSDFDNISARIYTQKSTTELATMTLKLQS